MIAISMLVQTLYGQKQHGQKQQSSIQAARTDPVPMLLVQMLDLTQQPSGNLMVTILAY